MPKDVPEGPKAKPPPARPAEVARDSLRANNTTTTILNNATNYFEDVIHLKESLLGDTLSGTAAEIRQMVGLSIRRWRNDWRLCVLLAILREIMGGSEFLQGTSSSALFRTYALDEMLTLFWLAVMQSYDLFLSYIVSNDLEDVCDLKPIANGNELSRSLGAKGGPWVGKALHMLVKWQLLHPEITDKEKALQEMCSRKQELGLG